MRLRAGNTLICATVAAFWMVTFAARGEPNPPVSQASARTEIILLGTLHGLHNTNANYSLEVLRRIIVALKPSAILVELPPMIGGRPTVQNGRISEQFSGNENTAANLAADALHVSVIPYDREGRNEFYEKTRYFNRVKEASERLDRWVEDQAQKDPESVEVLTSRVLYDSANGSQAYLMRNAGPETINSAALDMVIVNKKCIQHRVWPKMLAASGRQELAGEFLFIREEWEERNKIMAGNIAEIGRRHSGRRLVVLCGAEHRYFLRDLLAKAAGVTLKEFYEVPEWTGSGKGTRSLDGTGEEAEVTRQGRKGEPSAPTDAENPRR